MTDEKLFSWYAELELHGILERFPITGQDIDPGYFFASAQAATEQPLLKGSGSKRSGSVSGGIRSSETPSAALPLNLLTTHHCCIRVFIRSLPSGINYVQLRTKADCLFN